MNDNQGVSPASQTQENVLQGVNIQGSSNVITFAPTQNIIVETQVIQISALKVTQQQLIKASPYKGLNRFNASDRDRFYGRDKLIRRLLDAINGSGLTLVAGASGSGKSSVIRAGVIPELKQSLASQGLKDFIFTPGQDPFESLYRCLLSEEKDYRFSESDARIALSRSPDTLLKVIEKLKGNGERWIWFIDQFEELFTNCGDETIRQNFINGLAKVFMSGNQSVRIVLAMRADFLEQFSFYPILSAIANKNNLHLVSEMHPDELRQAIEQPAAKNGVVFETGLVEQIIKDVQGQRGYLPLLQYTLNLLWETECNNLGGDGRAEIEDRTLNISTYKQLEGVRGALQTRVNNIYRDLSSEQQSVTKQIFLKLVNIVDADGGSRPVSRRANQNEFEGKDVEEKLLATFVKENLLVSNTEYQSNEGLDFRNTSGKKQFATVEIAHEILLSSWDELKRWLEEEKESIILKNYLADEANRWQRIKQQQNEVKARDELVKGARLEQLLVLRQAKAFDKLGGLSALQSEFIDASLQWRQQQERQAKRRTQITIGALASFLIIVSGVALFAFNAKNEAVKLAASEKSARESAENANKQAVVAKQGESEALKIAQQQRDEAVKAKDDALKAEKTAKDEKKKAETEKNKALAISQNACLSMDAMVEVPFRVSKDYPILISKLPGDNLPQKIVRFVRDNVRGPRQDEIRNALNSINEDCEKLGANYAIGYNNRGG